MKKRAIVEYILAAVLGVIFGSLAGGGFFLRPQREPPALQGAARGFGIAIPEGSAGGDTSSLPQGTDTGVSGMESAQRPAQLWQVEQKPTAGHAFLGSGGKKRGSAAGGGGARAAA